MASVLGASVLWCGAPLGHFTSGVQFVSAKPSNHVGNVRVRRLESVSWRRLERGILRRSGATGWGGSNEVVEPLDLTEANVEQVLLDARSELLQLFDVSVGITGVVQLVELDGPFVKLRLTGRFWHERSMVLARVANYLQKRIPEIVEVEIEDESQLDDSAANF